MSRQSRDSHVAEFKRKLSELGFKDYAEYLASNHWVDVRRRFWASKLPKCRGGCGSGLRLELHHRTYKRLGAEYLMDLILVCRDCHQKIHAYERRSKVHMWRSTNRVLRGRRKEAVKARVAI